jgi:protein-tyrosine phosphatase
VTAAGNAPVAPFSVLVVCTANICRSPIAEAQLRAALGPSSGVEVTSAGLHARIGEPVDPRMAKLAEVPLAAFAARQLTAAMIRRADLVLVMTREQRSKVVTLLPAAVRSTFTLREFAQLADLAQEMPGAIAGESPAERLAALTALAPRLRAGRGAGAEDDIGDPYGRTDGAHAQAMAEIVNAVDSVSAAALGASRSTNQSTTVAEGSTPERLDGEQSFASGLPRRLVDLGLRGARMTGIRRA